MELGIRYWCCTIFWPIVVNSAPSPNLPHDALFRLTLPDARGHGASPMLSGRAYPPSELAADALAVLDAEGLQSAHLVAIGWAAATALALAATAPQRVTSLVLAAPYLPALVADSAEVAARQTGSAHLEMMQEVTVLAEKGQDGPGPRPVPDRDGLARTGATASRKRASEPSVVRPETWRRCWQARLPPRSTLMHSRGLKCQSCCSSRTTPSSWSA